MQHHAATSATDASAVSAKAIHSRRCTQKHGAGSNGGITSTKNHAATTPSERVIGEGKGIRRTTNTTDSSDYSLDYEQAFLDI